MFQKCFGNMCTPSIVRGTLSQWGELEDNILHAQYVKKTCVPDHKMWEMHVFHALVHQIIQPEGEVSFIDVCIFQGGRSKEQHSGNIVVREDLPGLSGSQEGEVEEEEGMVVERVESGTASHRDSAAGEHVHSSRSCHVYPSSHVTSAWVMFRAQAIFRKEEHLPPSPP